MSAGNFDQFAISHRAVHGHCERGIASAPHGWHRGQQAASIGMLRLTKTPPVAPEVQFLRIEECLRAFDHDNVIAVTLPALLYSKPGHYPMNVVAISAGRVTKSNTVEFVVH